MQKKIIISHLFDFDQRMIAFLFDPIDSLTLRPQPEVILFDSWEFYQEKKILIRAALDIWSCSGNLFLWELFIHLSQENIFKIYLALVNCKNLEPNKIVFPSHSIGPVR